MLSLLRRRFSGLVESIVRFPGTVAFLVAAAVLTAVAISNNDNDLTKYILTCAIGAVACAAGQSAYERFFADVIWRIIMMALAIIVTFLFYLSILPLSQNSAESIIRPAVTIFALFIAFIWIGVVKSRYSFSESFMAAFKALFQSVFFSGILFLGCIAIIAAIDRLITPVNSDAYAHTANIVFIIVAPLMLLSLIPVYPGSAQLEQGKIFDEKQRLLIERRIGSPKFLEVLLSYIVIPLASVFTVILLVYILLNIGGKFWTNNLLEPMLVAYTITVIVVTILVGSLENRFASLFRKIFPKVLIPIALFQIVASVLILLDTGVTYGRYYVILYGVLAVFSGVVLSVKPVRKSGVIAIVLIALSVISLIPPVDAFTVSRNSQINTMESVLIENGMLQNNVVTPNASISDKDKTRIITAVQYLSETDNLDEVTWLPARFNGYDDTAFFNLFGFHIYSPSTPGYQYVNVYYNIAGLIPITGYDIFTQVGIPYPDNTDLSTPATVNGKTYTVLKEDANGTSAIVVKERDGLELGRFDTKELFTRYAAYSIDKNMLTLDEATFSVENEKLMLKIIVLNAGFSTEPDRSDKNAQLMVFIKIK